MYRWIPDVSTGFCRLNCVSHFPMPLSGKQHEQEVALLEYCKAHQGPAIRALNVGHAPNATTYRDAFCDGAADLVRLYRVSGVANPVKHLSDKFISTSVLSCRGSEMSPAVTEYLYRHFLKERLSGDSYRVLYELTTERCPLCGKRKMNIAAHMQDAHPDHSPNADG
jgi:hypothetical protein